MEGKREKGEKSVKSRWGYKGNKGRECDQKTQRSNRLEERRVRGRESEWNKCNFHDQFKFETISPCTCVCVCVCVVCVWIHRKLGGATQKPTHMMWYSRFPWYEPLCGSHIRYGGKKNQYNHNYSVTIPFFTLPVRESTHYIKINFISASDKPVSVRTQATPLCNFHCKNWGRVRESTDFLVLYWQS